ncbi:MAG TPA: hypothetical protein ENI59_01795 [Euryarchaeota archaeon]|nr:hypothetical protein [Euryarchaeota archaeon]
MLWRIPTTIVDTIPLFIGSDLVLNEMIYDAFSRLGLLLTDPQTKTRLFIIKEESSYWVQTIREGVYLTPEKNKILYKMVEDLYNEYSH